MHADLASSQWATGRGETWRQQLSPMEAMLSPVDAPLIKALQLDGARRIADVGCGGGGTTRKIRKQAPEGSAVHGFDISPALIDEAKGRSEGLDIHFELADVSVAQAPAEPYDRLVSRFGTMFYVDPPSAFTGLRRWLVPGGRCVFAVWGAPKANPWAYSLREAIAEVVDVPSTDPEAPGPFRYAGAHKLLALLDQAGFEQLESIDWRGTLPLGGGLPAAQAVDFALTSFSIAGLLEGEDTGAYVAVRRSLTERFQNHERGGEVRLEAHVHLVTGISP